MATPNSLGLDFEQLTVKDQQQDSSKPEAAQSAVSPGPSDAQPSDAARTTETREKKKPYVNTERVKTGGSQRDKLSEEALTERMARMREQNEKIKQRRLDVQADEEAFRKTQESERAKLAQNRKVQANIDRTREQNAQRKMDKIQSREWDSGKPTGDWKSNPNQEATSQPSDNDKNAEGTGSVDAASPPRDSGNWTRGNSRGGSQRARGRGRGRGGSTTPAAAVPNNHQSSEVSTSSSVPNAATPKEATS